MSDKEICVALAGQPNAGKTALFNMLTGLRRKVANYPGVTVERSEGALQLASGQRVTLMDLPGTYSMVPKSDDEKVTTNTLKGELKGVNKPDIVIAVINVLQLRTQLPFLLALAQLNLPMVVALNMTDRAQKFGLKIDTEALSHLLNAKVIRTIASRGFGKGELIAAIQEQVVTLKNSGFDKTDRDLSIPQESGGKVLQKIPKDPMEAARVLQTKAAEIYPKLILQAPKHDAFTEKLDSIFLHKIFGPVILLLILFFTFQAVFTLAAPPSDFIEGVFQWLAELATASLPEGFVRKLLVEGIIAGIGSVLVFLPQICILFVILLTLEDTGYMSRAAVILDRPLRTLGLSGKSVFPLLSGYACAIPGIMSSRTISSTHERNVTMALVPLTTCSARLPVYTLLIAAFVPQRSVLGAFQLQGLVMFALYFASGLAVIGVSLLARGLIPRHDTPSLLLELPAIMPPSARNIFLSVFDRAKAFLQKAGTYILLIMVVLWAATNFPTPPAQALEPAINYSIAGRVGEWLSPLFEPIGLNWKIVVAIVSGFAAREVLVSALGVVYAVDAEGGNIGALASALQSDWHLASAFALMAWYVFAPQCLATFAVLQRETKSLKFTMAIFLAYLGMAYVAAGITYHAARYLLQ